MSNAKQKQKLIEDYQNAIFKYTFENEQLEKQIKDLKITLTLNQNLLYDYVIKSAGDNDEIHNMVNDTKKIWEENQSLIEKKNFFEIKIARLQELIEDTPTVIREEINKISMKSNKIQEELTEKDKIIKKLKLELYKTRKNALFRNARTEVYVTEPSKANLEIGQELLILRAMLSKVTPMHFKKMDDAEKLKKNIDELKVNLNKLLQRALEVQNRMNNYNKKDIMNIEYTKNDLNNLYKNIEGYDIDADKSEEEEEDDDDDDYDAKNNNNDNNDESSSDDEISMNNKKKLKLKEKELEKLTEQYNKLKEEAQQYENKINKHKQVYKEIKEKMRNLRNSAAYS